MGQKGDTPALKRAGEQQLAKRKHEIKRKCKQLNFFTYDTIIPNANGGENK